MDRLAHKYYKPKNNILEVKSTIEIGTSYRI